MANGFAGKYEHSLDIKGRAIIPAAFREKLGIGFTIAFNTSFDALAIYPIEKWDSVNEQLSKVRDTDDEGMDYVRLILANAQTDLEMDAQGRVLLPSLLRETIGLGKDLTFIGMRDHVEIWDTGAYLAKEKRARENLVALRRHVNDSYQ